MYSVRMSETGGEDLSRIEKLRSVRLIRDISPRLEIERQDFLLDEYIDSFFSDDGNGGTFPRTPDHILRRENAETQTRVNKLRLLESEEGGYLCTMLREAIRNNFSGEQKILLLEAAKYMIRVHIDDGNRSDTGLPGVSHQIKVALNTARVLLTRDPYYRHNANILAAAIFHDIVEDHEWIPLLEKNKINNLKRKGVIPEDMSKTNQVITLLEDAGGIMGKHNGVLGIMMRSLTLNRSALLQKFKGLSRDEARKVAEELDKEIEVDLDLPLEEQKRLKEADKEKKTAIKNELYRYYVQDTITDSLKFGEASSLIKFMDLEDNALNIGDIRKRYLALRESKNDSTKRTAEKLRVNYNKFQIKYKPILEDAMNLLETWPLNTWVGDIASGLRKKIEKVLVEEYVSPL